MVHPTDPFDLEPFFPYLKSSFRRQPRQRVVVGSVSRGLAFLTDPLLALDDHRLGRLQAQVDLHPLVGRTKEVARPALVEPCLPALVPDPVPLDLGARPANPCPIELLGVLKSLSFQVCYGKVGRVEIAYCPAGRVDGCGLNPNPEEGQLVPKPTAIASGKIAGVVPPFDLVVGVSAVIPREGECVRGQGLFPGLLLGGRRIDRVDGTRWCRPSPDETNQEQELERSCRPPDIYDASSSIDQDAHSSRVGPVLARDRVA